MSTRITTKAAMYELLTAGELGNTIPQFFDRAVWSRFVGDHVDKYPYWGIRSAVTAMGAFSRLNVTTPDVYLLLDEHYPTGGFNVSPMIDRYALLRVEYTPGQTGLTYVDPAREGQLDRRHPWRDGFKRFPVHVHSPAAIRSILKAYLWPADLENLDRLADEYPDHTIEFSACDRPCGLRPMNNTVIWEVRLY